MTRELKTAEELVAFYEEKAPDDWLGVVCEDVARHLPIKALATLCKEDADLSKHEPVPCTRDAVVGLMRDYMEFAWNKALGHRGISAGRSLDHFGAWLWMLNDTETLAFLEEEDNYPQYGCPVLKRICEQYDLSVPAGDDVDRMVKGEPCHPGCDEGCS